ncbi:hypothetical protein XENOCAPTIV_004024 [Xenoophorus captivus]|uniref:AMP-activated protein kinase glycogen-binding domain-containing protein n=1 Tax=Xenoophorus captivus TaxID=1517983 RepID=A0ABV0QGB6_9TELE
MVGSESSAVFLCVSELDAVRVSMGNSSSERSFRDGQSGGKEARPNIMMDSTDDAELFHREDPKEFLAWQQDLDCDSKDPTQARPTVFRWTGSAKEVYVSGSFNNWATKIPLNRRLLNLNSSNLRCFLMPELIVYLFKCDMLFLKHSQNNFVAIVDLPEGEHQYKFCVDGQWTLDPTGVSRCLGFWR